MPRADKGQEVLSFQIAMHNLLIFRYLLAVKCVLNSLIGKYHDWLLTLKIILAISVECATMRVFSKF